MSTHHKFEANETVTYMQLRIDALNAENERLNNLVIDKDIAIEQLKGDVAEQKSQFNMLVRNINVIDEIYLQPIKNN